MRLGKATFFLAILLLSALLVLVINSSFLPETKAQTPCSGGQITSPCECGGQEYWAGYCCQGIWFDPYYENVGGCPAENFYVDNSPGSGCSDSGPGTEAQPWCTMQHACATLIAGQAVIVKNGTYYVVGTGSRARAALTPVNSGTHNNPIIFKTYPGDEVTIEMSSGVGPLIGVYRVNYSVWDGFKVIEGDSYTRDTGPVVVWHADNVTLQNLEIISAYVDPAENDGDNHDGIRIEGQDVSDTQNHSANNVVRNCLLRGDSRYVGNHNFAGIKIYGVKNLLVEHNEVIDYSDGYYLKGWGYNNTIRYNIFDNGDWGLWIQYQNHPTVYQNIFHTDASCFSMFSYSGNISIYNNVINVGNRGINRWGTQTPDNTWFFNNIFYSTPAPFNILSVDIGNIFSNYNCFYDYDVFRMDYAEIGRLPEWQAYGYDLDSPEANPLFVDPPNDFHLQSGSPCVGIDRQDYDGDGDTSEPINMGPYITGDEIIGRIPESYYYGQGQTCQELAGASSWDCCSSGQICDGGIFMQSSDCGNLCCIGGQCAEPSICQITNAYWS